MAKAGKVNMYVGWAKRGRSGELLDPKYLLSYDVRGRTVNVVFTPHEFIQAIMSGEKLSKQERMNIRKKTKSTALILR